MRTIPLLSPKPRRPVHEMAVSDAVMQMDFSDRPFVVFRNASHGEINVVYRRDDGNIGWIDPGGEPAALKQRSGSASKEALESDGAVPQSGAKKARKRR